MSSTRIRQLQSKFMNLDIQITISKDVLKFTTSHHVDKVREEVSCDELE